MNYLNKLVEKATQCFDKSSQDLILIEEMSELTKELLKRRRGKCNIDNIKEELSHVLISTMVLQKVLGISQQDIEDEAKRKLEKYGWLEQEENVKINLG